MSESLASCEWVASWLGLATRLDYDLRLRDTLNREIKLVSIMKQPQQLDICIITDAKSLYDNMDREQNTKDEKRVALECCGLSRNDGWSSILGAA